MTFTETIKKGAYIICFEKGDLFVIRTMVIFLYMLYRFKIQASLKHQTRDVSLNVYAFRQGASLNVRILNFWVWSLNLYILLYN